MASTELHGSWKMPPLLYILTGRAQATCDLCGMNFEGGATFCFRQHSLWLGMYFLAMNDAIFLCVHLSIFSVKSLPLFCSLLLPPVLFVFPESLSIAQRSLIQWLKVQTPILDLTSSILWFRHMVCIYFFFCFSVTSFISFFSKNMWVGLVRWLNFYKLLLFTPKALVWFLGFTWRN